MSSTNFVTQNTITQDSLPRFNAINPEEVGEEVKIMLNKNRDHFTSLLNTQGTFTWENLMQPLEEMDEELNQLASPINHLNAVMESDTLRKVHNELQPLLSAYHTEFAQNEKYFQAVVALANHADYKNLNIAQRKILEDFLLAFKLSGIHLSTDKKILFAEIQKKLSLLTTKFAENVLDATQAWSLHLTDEKDLAGLPHQAMQLAKETAEARGLKGYLLTLDYPSYSSAIKYLDKRELRKTLSHAYSTRASDQGPNAGKWDNAPIMDEILKLRHEKALLVGFKNYAEYSLARKMAKDPNEVIKFLQDLVTRSKPIAEQEYKELTDFAKTMHGLDKLEAWDLAYYSEKLMKSKFNFTQEEIRPYFPIQKVLQGMFSIVNTIYGISIKKNPDIEVWHNDVEFFSVYDEQNNLRGGFYIDLYARPNKRDGAWMDDCRVRRRTADNKIQHPVAYLTCNFMRPVESNPALLTHDEVITLFHEFGHCLHHILTKVDYAAVSGINGVPWDAVEFPSQFMENFCWEKVSLELISGHFETGAPLPDDLFQKMLAAKNFHTGFSMLRQLEFALFDFKLHLEFDPSKVNQVKDTLASVRKTTSVIPVPEYNRFENSFSHIFAGGYAAGYYSYKWAEVLSSDAYELFAENNILDRHTGKSFMENILEVGGVREPMESFIAFRGRAPSIDALLKQSGI